MKTIFLITAAVFSKCLFVQAQRNNDQNCSSFEQVVCNNPNFLAVCAATMISDLDNQLSGRNWTLFVPTNEAILDMPHDTLKDYPHTLDTMESLLLYHSVPDQVIYSRDLGCDDSVVMGNGQQVEIVCEGDNDDLYLLGQENNRDDMAEIEYRDLMMCNGVIHGISQVLLPMMNISTEGPGTAPSSPPTISPVPGRQMPTIPRGAPSAMPSDMISDVPSIQPTSLDTSAPSLRRTAEPSLAVPSTAPVEGRSGGDDRCSRTVGEIACENDGFDTLCRLVEEAGLDETRIGESGRFTVFAPEDRAFELLPEETLSDLQRNEEELKNLLLFHVILDETLYSQDLECTHRLEMGNGRDSRTVCRRGHVYQKGNGNNRDEMPEIIEADIRLCHGVVHRVDRVLLP